MLFRNPRRKQSFIRVMATTLACALVAGSAWIHGQAQQVFAAENPRKIDYIMHNNKNIAFGLISNLKAVEEGKALEFDYRVVFNSSQAGAGMFLNFTVDDQLLPYFELAESSYFYLAGLEHKHSYREKPSVGPIYGRVAENIEGIAKFPLIDNSGLDADPAKPNYSAGLIPQGKEDETIHLRLQFKQDIRPLIKADETDQTWLRSYLTYLNPTTKQEQIQTSSKLQIPLRPVLLRNGLNNDAEKPEEQKRYWHNPLGDERVYDSDPAVIQEDSLHETSMRVTYIPEFNALQLHLIYHPYNLGSNALKDESRGVLLFDPELLPYIDSIELWRIGLGGNKQFSPFLETAAGSSVWTTAPGAPFNRGYAAATKREDGQVVPLSHVDPNGTNTYGERGLYPPHQEEIQGKPYGVMIFDPEFVGQHDVNTLYNTWSTNTQQTRIIIYLKDNPAKIFGHEATKAGHSLRLQHMFTNVRSDRKDSLQDLEEDRFYVGSLADTSFEIRDTDGDGLIDDFEQYIETDPRKQDTDGDGKLDGEEVQSARSTYVDRQLKYVGTDPLTPIPDYPNEKIEPSRKTYTGKIAYGPRTVALWRYPKGSKQGYPIAETVSDENGNYTLEIGKLFERAGDNLIKGHPSPEEARRNLTAKPAGPTDFQEGDEVQLEIWTDGWTGRGLYFSKPERPGKATVGQSDNLEFIHLYNTEEPTYIATLPPTMHTKHGEAGQATFEIKVDGKPVPEDALVVDRDKLTAKLTLPEEVLKQLPRDEHGRIKAGTSIEVTAKMGEDKPNQKTFKLLEGPQFGHVEDGQFKPSNIRPSDETIVVLPPADFDGSEKLEIQIGDQPEPVLAHYDETTKTYRTEKLEKGSLTEGTELTILTSRAGQPLHPVKTTVTGDETPPAALSFEQPHLGDATLQINEPTDDAQTLIIEVAKREGEGADKPIEMVTVRKVTEPEGGHHWETNDGQAVKLEPVDPKQPEGDKRLVVPVKALETEEKTEDGQPNLQVSAKARDAAGNESTATVKPVLPVAVPPQPTFYEHPHEGDTAVLINAPDEVATTLVLTLPPAQAGGAEQAITLVKNPDDQKWYFATPEGKPDQSQSVTTKTVASETPDQTKTIFEVPVSGLKQSQEISLEAKNKQGQASEKTTVTVLGERQKPGKPDVSPAQPGDQKVKVMKPDSKDSAVTLKVEVTPNEEPKTPQEVTLKKNDKGQWVIPGQPDQTIEENKEGYLEIPLNTPLKDQDGVKVVGLNDHDQAGEAHTQTVSKLPAKVTAEPIGQGDQTLVLKAPDSKDSAETIEIQLPAKTENPDKIVLEKDKNTNQWKQGEEVVSDSEGKKITVSLPAPANDKEVFTVTPKDAQGRSGPDTTVTTGPAIDRTPPKAAEVQAPYADEVIVEVKAPSGQDHDDATQFTVEIPGEKDAEPTVVTIEKVQDGTWKTKGDQPQNVSVNDGYLQIPVGINLKEGQRVKVTSSDGQNAAQPTEVTTQGQRQVPAAPVVDPVGSGDKAIRIAVPATPTAHLTVEIKSPGAEQPKETLELHYDKNQKAWVDAKDQPVQVEGADKNNPKLVVTLTDPAQENDEVKVTAADQAKRNKNSTDLTVSGPIDRQAPDTPQVKTPHKGENFVEVKVPSGENNDDATQIEVTWPAQNETEAPEKPVVTVVKKDEKNNWVDENNKPVKIVEGHLVIEGPATLEKDAKVKVLAKDPSGNSSQPATVTVTEDRQKPNLGTVKAVQPGDTALDIELPKDSTTTVIEVKLPGEGEDTTTIRVEKQPDGSWKFVEKQPDGSWKVVEKKEPEKNPTLDDKGHLIIPIPAANDNATIKLVPMDPYGNKGDEVNLTVGANPTETDESAIPAEPTVQPIHRGDENVLIKEPKDANKIEITLPGENDSSNTITVVKKEDGSWEIPGEPPVVIKKDADGNLIIPVGKIEKGPVTIKVTNPQGKSATKEVSLEEDKPSPGTDGSGNGSDNGSDNGSAPQPGEGGGFIDHASFKPIQPDLDDEDPFVVISKKPLKPSSQAGQAKQAGQAAHADQAGLPATGETTPMTSLWLLMLAGALASAAIWAQRLTKPTRQD